MIQPVQTERPSAAKTIAKAALTGAAVAGSALYLAKSGKLDKFVGKNQHVDKGINGLKTAADKVWSVLEPQVAKVKPLFDKISGRVKPVADKVKTTAKDTAGKAKPLFEKAKTFVTGIYTNAKAAVTRFFSEKNPADTVVEAMAGKFN